jgi:hypothetical protein
LAPGVVLRNAALGNWRSKSFEIAARRGDVFMATINQPQEDQPISSAEGQGETVEVIVERRLSPLYFVSLCSVFLRRAQKNRTPMHNQGALCQRQNSRLRKFDHLTLLDRRHTCCIPCIPQPKEKEIDCDNNTLFYLPYFSGCIGYQGGGRVRIGWNM